MTSLIYKKTTRVLPRADAAGHFVSHKCARDNYYLILTLPHPTLLLKKLKFMYNVKRFIKTHQALIIFWAVVGVWLFGLLFVVILSSPADAESLPRATVVESETGVGLDVYSGLFFGPDGARDFAAEYHHRVDGQEEGQVTVLSRDGLIYIVCSGDTAFALADEFSYYENLEFLAESMYVHLLNQTRVSL